MPINVYSLPMRNGNEGYDLDEAIEARVYSLPMRNGNLTPSGEARPNTVMFIVYL